MGIFFVPMSKSRTATWHWVVADHYYIPITRLSMSASDQHPPASTPPESAELIPAQAPTASRPLLATIAGGGTLIVLVTGAVVGLGDWLAGWQLTRPWLQLSATFVGMLLLAGVFVPTIARPRRIIMG